MEAVPGPLLGAIADDVTGATDLCSALAHEGMRAVLTFGAAREVDLPEADAVVVALKSRTAPATTAVRDALDALDRLRDLGTRRFFFKVCSTFDSTPEGNIGPVADALLDALGGDLEVVCPAYPANGRTVAHGHLFVDGRLLSESSLSTHPLTPMTDPDLVRFLGLQTPRRVGLVPLGVVRRGVAAIEQRLRELRREGVAHAVVDALEEDDLAALAEACRDLPLVTGGAGLARGLPDAYRRGGLLAEHAAAPELPPVGGAAVVIAGSCSAATREQVRRMTARHPSVRVDALAARDDPHAAEAVAAEAASHLGEGPVLVYSTAPPDEVARVQERLGARPAGAAVEELLADVARRLVADGVRRLIVAGGETSGAVVQAVGLQALVAEREIAPGVPRMVSLGEPRMAFAFKSGNFGGPDFFFEALEAVR